MDRFDMEDVVAPVDMIAESPLKDWRLKNEAGTLQKTDFIDFFQKKSPNYFSYKYQNEVDSAKLSLKCSFNEGDAKAEIIDVLLEFIMGNNPQAELEKLRQEGNAAAVCGRVFKYGEPTYSCRECGMDPTCVLCVKCFKKSAHRYHKYKMATSGGGGCCDCGDEEAWKKDHYCEDHLRGKDQPVVSNIITEAMKERFEMASVGVLTFCVNYLEIESNASLKCLEGQTSDNYCTVLYNDESHTFDQVMQTLTFIIKCPLRDAYDIATNVDREGRAVVKCDQYYECFKMKEAIEKQSPRTVANSSLSAQPPLRVSVLHMQALSCQQFAIQLLTWYQDFLTHHAIFREIFARIILNKKAPYSIRRILENDVKLWKAARTAWHRLLISGMLIEYDNKMTLAREFSRHYATVVQDFIRDDHEHSYSIVSLSVQLFTVPSIAHHLIAHEDIFFKLLHTFYHEAIEKFIQNKVLVFNKNMNSMSFFKRAAYILYDLRYLLSFKPDTWTQDLRDGFLEGCKLLLKLLNVIQGMEPVKRQMGQHMDYEPEWECAFNLHIKLANTIALVLDWCSSDRDVLMKLYQMVMRCLVANPFLLQTVNRSEREFTGHTAECIVYDISTKPVSIHLPLTRLYAGIYLHLGKYGLDYESASSGLKRTPVELFEPILCAQTMIAQVNSGMWRRNGYSLLHQLYFYRNVRCRAEMLDRDVIGLQIGASLIESNQFIIHLMNKFNLINWMGRDYEKNLTLSLTDDEFVRPLSMVDEFLELLIVIIGERFLPGISEISFEDHVKKELIQYLCIRSHSHSELGRCLPETYNDTAIEDVVHQVADFKKPARPDAKGVYELKDEFYDSYNMYFYHYTKEEKSKSEELYRERRKRRGELVCCPPPTLPKLTPNFTKLVNLLQCDVMLEIMSTVIERALDLKARCFLENHLQKVLFLIGMGLQEQQSSHYSFLSFYEAMSKRNFLPKLEELSRSARVESNRDFILWTIKKIKDLRPEERSMDDEGEHNNENEESRGQSADTGSGVSSTEKEALEKRERARLAAERRAKIMEQMQSAQKNFMITNPDMFEKMDDASKTATAATAMPDTRMEWQGDESMEEGATAYKSVACVGFERRLPQLVDEDHKCIVCFEDCVVNIEGPTLVYPAFLQKSRVLPPESGQPHSVHASSCGHIMHATCWQEYYNNEDSQEQRRPHRNRLPFLTTTQSTEFLCPYCRCLCNTVLPVTPQLSRFGMPKVLHIGDTVVPYAAWISVIRSLSEELEKVKTIHDTDLWFYALPTMDTLLECVKESVNLPLFNQAVHLIDTPPPMPHWLHYLQHYTKTARQHSHTSFSDNVNESTHWLWQSCIYTIESLEVYMRAANKSFTTEMTLRHKSCISGLIRASFLFATTLTAHDMRCLIEPLSELLQEVFFQRGKSVLEWNCFNKMVSMMLMLPNMLYSIMPKKSALSNGNLLDLYTVQLFFAACMVKAIVVYEAPEEDQMDVDSDGTEIDPDVANLSSDVRDILSNFYRRYNYAARHRNYNNDLALIKCDERTLTALFDFIRSELLGFLRCTCLLFHFITDVPYPDAGCNTFTDMCNYLGITTNLASYFESSNPLLGLMDAMAAHTDTCTSLIVPSTRIVPRLCDLPDDYSDLINNLSSFACPNNQREEARSPMMCLVCGEVVCGQSYCCQLKLNGRIVGACTYHAYHCGGEIGIFLRVRDCQIIYLGRNKGCFVQPPYLDDYGETDQGLRRGNPLHLCRERYKKFHLTWLDNGLHEEIGRQNDSSGVAVTQWHHM